MGRFARVTFLTVAAAVLFGVAPVRTWNNHGHMMVAFLAYRQLSTVPVVKTKIDALVRLNPLIQEWDRQVAPLPVDLRTAALFAIAATWPDIIKFDQLHHDDGPDGGNRPPPDQSAFANVGYSDTARHKYWHFIDTPFTPDQTPLPQEPVPNAVERIPLFRSVLASTTAAQPLKSYDLVWLLHLVGDLHQPLHAATRVSHSQPDGDNGGNAVLLCSSPCVQELHGFWDGALGNDEAPIGLLIDAASVHVPGGSHATDLDPKHWATESLTLARSDVYKAPIGLGAGPFTLNTAYVQNAQRVASERVALAAARLANILKTDLQ